MKKLLVLVLVMAMAGSAFAVADDGVRNLGIYFDMTADAVCTQAAPYGMVTAYLILTNPDVADIGGVEYTLTVDATAQLLSTTWMVGSVVDVGNDPGEHVVGFAGPFATSPATVLAMMSLINLDATGGPIFFSMGPSTPSSLPNGLPVILSGETLLPTGYSNLDGFHMAQINGLECTPVATDAVSFDSVKSLYR
jgi:hypothetical protein